MDPDVVRVKIAEAGGPELQLVGPLAGGSVGAWQVRWPDGHPGVLTWTPPLLQGESPGRLAEVQALVELGRAAGLPLPRYEAVVDLGPSGAAVLQERANGRPPTVVTEPLLDQVLELAARRRSLLAGKPVAARPLQLHLVRDGPGYCLHEPLRTFSPRSAALFARVEEIGAGADEVVGDDLVHFDYHLGNVLVADDDPELITAIVDWDGACAGPIGLDLALLAFDCSLRTTQRLEERVARSLHACVSDDQARRLCAHVALRLVDWSIRHGGDVEHWLSVSERRLDC